MIKIVSSVTLSASSQTHYVPRMTLEVMLYMTKVVLIFTMQYFGYVFWFLAPQNLVRHIREDAIKTADKGAHEQDRADCYTAQAEMLFALEELTDIANNSISGKDKIIASAATTIQSVRYRSVVRLRERANQRGDESRIRKA